MENAVCRMTVLLAVMCLAATSALSMPSYNDVLLVVNAQSSESQEIGAYFKAARNIPDANVCTISVKAGSDGARMGNTEKWAALAAIKNHLIKNGLTDKINYIVLTRGIPTYAYTGIKGPAPDYVEGYHLFDVFLMYQLSESAINPAIPDIFTDNKYFYYNNPGMKLYAAAAKGQNYIDVVECPLKVGDVFRIAAGSNEETKAITGIGAGAGYYRVAFDSALIFAYTYPEKTRILSEDFPKLTKKFSKTKFGYSIVGRLDGLGTVTIKNFIDNTGAPAYESYKKQTNGKMKLLTLSPNYTKIFSDEIRKRGNIEVVSPLPGPLVQPFDPKVQIKTTFESIAKDVMFAFLDNVWGACYGEDEFVTSYPFIYRGATFLPGSVLTCFRSFPASTNSHGDHGGIGKMNVATKAKSSYVKLDSSDMKFRHMTCTAYDPVNNQLWTGTGADPLRAGITLSSVRYSCTNDIYLEIMCNFGGGIAIYDASGNVLKYINANDPGSPLKNNRVVKLLYDKNSQYMWVVHYKGIQYCNLKDNSWHDIPALQNDYAAGAGICLDPFDSDNVYFSFFVYQSAISSHIAGAGTSIFEYKKSAKTVTPYVIDATSNIGIAPQMGKTSANTIWVSKNKCLYRYDLSTRKVVEKLNMSAIIPEMVTPPANLKSPVDVDCIHNVVTIPAEKVVLAAVGCYIYYTKDLIEGTPSKCQKKTYVVRITESSNPAVAPSTIEPITNDKMNQVGGSMPAFHVQDVAIEPADGKTIYMALSKPGTVVCSTDAGKAWSLFSSDYSTFYNVNGIALDGKGNIYAARGYAESQNIVADFQAFGLCAFGGGMTHDSMSYAPTQYGLFCPTAPYYAQPNSCITFSLSSDEYYSQTEPMMFMLLDGFYMGEARLGVFNSYPATGGGGYIGHMTVFEPKCAPFAPRVDEENLKSQVINKTTIEIPLFSPGLTPKLDGFIPETINANTVKITDETGNPVSLSKMEYNAISRKIVLTGDLSANVYQVTLKCGIDGIKNIKGASLTNTRANEYKDEITYVFGDGIIVNPEIYKPPVIIGPVQMPQYSAKCDLMVNKVWWDKAPAAGQPLTVKFQITNIGTVTTSAKAGDLIAKVYLNNIKMDAVPFGNLAAKQSVTLSSTITGGFIAAGKQTTIMVWADANSKLAESRESNNTNSAKFFLDNRPDLIVKEITLSSTRPGKTTVNLKIANVGFGPTAAGTGAQTAAVYVNNSQVGTVNYNDLAKGAVVALKLDNVNMTAGLRKVKVVADSAGIVSEVSKTNNSLEKPFSIK